MAELGMAYVKGARIGMTLRSGYLRVTGTVKATVKAIHNFVFGLYEGMADPDAAEHTVYHVEKRLSGEKAAAAVIEKVLKGSENAPAP